MIRAMLMGYRTTDRKAPMSNHERVDFHRPLTERVSLVEYLSISMASIVAFIALLGGFATKGTFWFNMGIGLAFAVLILEAFDASRRIVRWIRRRMAGEARTR